MHKEHPEAGAISERVDRVGSIVVDAALTVHRALGPGLLESVYEACLTEELRRRGLSVEQQVGVPVVYGDVKMDIGFRLDLLVEGSVVVEIKAIDALASIHAAQVLTYLRFSGHRLGFLNKFQQSSIERRPAALRVATPWCSS